MKRRQLLSNGWGLGLGLLAADTMAAPASPAAGALQWQSTTFTGMGTTLSITAAHADKQRTVSALEQARELVAQLEMQMSVFNPNSALSRLNAHGVLKQPPPDLLRLLRIAKDFAARSHGAFDPTVQPLWTLFSSRQAAGRLPLAGEVAQARRLVDWRKLRIETDRIALAQHGMGVTLNGIAQGFASDQVRALLKSHGIEHALINTGEWSALGQSSQHQDWLLGVADPHQTNALLGRLRLRGGGSLATSADDQTFFSPDHLHHHIFDPHTGYSPRDISSVTVLAKHCTQADALTKVLFVAGYERALALAQQWQVTALVVHKSGQWQMSPQLHWV